MSARRHRRPPRITKVPHSGTHAGVTPALSEPRPSGSGLPAEPRPSGSGLSVAPDAAILHEFRRRMGCVGKLVRDLCGLSEDTDPRLVVRDAYLVVVSEIIHAIATAEERLPTDELAALSKAVAEHRRLDLSQMELERKSGGPAAGGGVAAPAGDARGDTVCHSETPGTLGEAVRSVYGADLSAPPGSAAAP